jgi:hypothetical protein
MGFGEKVDFQSGRKLNLDAAYRSMIKPTVEEAGLECYRADEIVHSGVIDVPMYQQILTADVVIADLSTSNSNAFYELGVRHALRPYTTIIVAEDQFQFPFDLPPQVPFLSYRHLGEDIGVREVRRFREALGNLLVARLQDQITDSPVYIFLSDLIPSSFGKQPTQAVQDSTLATLIEQGELAIKNNQFSTAKTLFTAALQIGKGKPEGGVITRNPYLIQHMVLATYKAEQHSRSAALFEARQLLEYLIPKDSNDPVTFQLLDDLEFALSKDSNDPATFQLLDDLEFALPNEIREIGYSIHEQQAYEELEAIKRDDHNRLIYRRIAAFPQYVRDNVFPKLLHALLNITSIYTIQRWLQRHSSFWPILLGGILGLGLGAGTLLGITGFVGAAGFLLVLVTVFWWVKDAEPVLIKPDASHAYTDDAEIERQENPNNRALQQVRRDLQQVIQREEELKQWKEPRDVDDQIERVLLGEFSSSSLLGAWAHRLPLVRRFVKCPRGQEGWRLALAFFLTTIVACLLALASDAAIMSVTITQGNNGASLPINFGYLTELNAGPAYLVLIPAIILIAFRFIGASQAALQSFASNHHLIYNPRVERSGERSDTVKPLMFIERWNRKLFSLLLPPILILVFGLVIGSEVRPSFSGGRLHLIGDYFDLAFGYVHAIFLPDYEDGWSLQELEAKTRRRVNELPQVPQQDFPKWKIESKTGGPRTWWQQRAFALFLPLHVLLEWMFASFAAWFVLKTVFLFWLVYCAIQPSASFPVELKLNFSDKSRNYGLGLFNRAWNYLLGSIALGVILQFCSRIANARKGSWPPLPLFLLIFFGAYIIALSFKVHAAIDAEIEQRGSLFQQQKVLNWSLRLRLLVSFLFYMTILFMPDSWNSIIAQGWIQMLHKIARGT